MLDSLRRSLPRPLFAGIACALAHELPDRLAALRDDGYRAALGVDPVACQVDPQVVEDRRREVRGRDPAAVDGVTALVRAADDLAVPQAAAGYQHGHDVLPVPSAAGPGQDRVAPELPEHEDQRRVEEPARLEVAHERIERPVDRG